jgi:hypothetical protein
MRSSPKIAPLASKFHAPQTTIHLLFKVSDRNSERRRLRRQASSRQKALKREPRLLVQSNGEEPTAAGRMPPASLCLPLGICLWR